MIQINSTFRVGVTSFYVCTFEAHLAGAIVSASRFGRLEADAT